MGMEENFLRPKTSKLRLKRNVIRTRALTY